jgi:hypothetical protein
LVSGRNADTTAGTVAIAGRQTAPSHQRRLFRDAAECGKLVTVDLLIAGSLRLIRLPAARIRRRPHSQNGKRGHITVPLCHHEAAVFVWRDLRQPSRLRRPFRLGNSLQSSNSTHVGKESPANFYVVPWQNCQYCCSGRFACDPDSPVSCFPFPLTSRDKSK